MLSKTYDGHIFSETKSLSQIKKCMIAFSM